MSVAYQPDPHAETRPWWRGAVIYQIYPRSFRDANGDGIGDLEGVICGLDHIASLGVDAIWLSPFFPSPMRDFGYDVADHCGVDPMFGTLADFDRLVERAHALKLKVLIDQVWSHTSDRHPWFTESRSSRTNPKADWFVWADPKADGSPPNNWQSVFHGPSWTWDARRRQYYLHNFLAEQPDLDLHNPEVQDAILKVARFWLDRGVDGFRLDAVNFLMCDPKLRDNPPSAASGRPYGRPYDYQEHSRSQSHPDIPGFLEHVRAVFDDYGDRFTVAEVGGAQALAEMKAFTERDLRLNSAYGFTFLYAPRLTAQLVKGALADWSSRDGEGWPSWTFSNHDAPRAVSRWADEADRSAQARLNLLLLLSLRGDALMYQGEELGLPQGEVPFERLVDPEAIANWPATLGRDGARTPIPWRSKAAHAGFSTAEPWLPVDPRHSALAVDVQDQDPGSMLAYARRAIGFRKSRPALVDGDLKLLDAPEDVVAFERTSKVERLICVFNLGKTAAAFAPPAGAQLLFAANLDATGAPPAALAPLSGYVASIG